MTEGYQVKRCCDESYNQQLYAAYKVYPIDHDNYRILIELDDYGDYDDVKYCAYCGKPLELEPRPQPEQTPEQMRVNYLQGLNAKDRALEELKDQMNGTIKAKDLLLWHEARYTNEEIPGRDGIHTVTYPVRAKTLTITPELIEEAEREYEQQKGNA